MLTETDEEKAAREEQEAEDAAAAKVAKAAGATGDDEGKKKKDAKADDDLTPEQQKAFDKALKAREKELEDEITEKVTAKLAEEAETVKKTKAGEFEKLYNAELAKVTKLETKVTELEGQVEELGTIVDDEIAARKKVLPKDLLDLMPESDGDKLKDLRWLRKAQEKSATGFMGESPNYKGPSGDEKKLYGETVQQFEGSGLYDN